MAATTDALHDAIASAISPPPESSAVESPSEPSTPPSESPPEEAVTPEKAVEEKEEFRFSDEPPKEKEEEAKEEQEEESPPDRIPRAELKKLEGMFMRTERGRRAIAALKVQNQLEKDPEEGGIGFAPTADQIKEFFQDSSDLRTMADEFHSGDPAKAANFIQQWFAPGEDGKLSRGAIAVASQLPSVLASDPALQPLYTQLAVPIVENFIEEISSHARRGVNPQGAQMTPEEKVNWTAVAVAMRTWLTGQEISEAEWKRIVGELSSASAPPPVDPRSAEVEAKLRRIEEIERNQRLTARKSFEEALSKERDALVMSDIHEALKPLKDAFPDDIYAPIAEKLFAEVQSKVSRNPFGLRNIAALRDRAWASRNSADLAAVARAWRDLARPVIKSLRLKYLSSAAPLMRQRSEERHEVASAAAGKVGNSSPAAQSPATAGAARPQGMSADAWIEQSVRKAIQGT